MTLLGKSPDNIIITLVLASKLIKHLLCTRLNLDALGCYLCHFKSQVETVEVVEYKLLCLKSEINMTFMPNITIASFVRFTPTQTTQKVGKKKAS